MPYTKSINAAGQGSPLLRSNGFNFPDISHVYVFGADMTANANADGSLTVSGKLTWTQPGDGTTQDWDNATITFSEADVNAFNKVVYGQTRNSAASFTETAWTSSENYTKSILKIPTCPTMWGPIHRSTTTGPTTPPAPRSSALRSPQTARQWRPNPSCCSATDRKPKE